MSNFRIEAAPIPDIRIVQSRRLDDTRGFFLETYNESAFAAAGIDIHFVQDNHSHSREPGTLRGLHYQRPPFAQDKLVRVIRGRIWDVGVDIRRNSPTFGKWFGLELSAENQTQLFIPSGFAHGFVTLEPDTEVTYKVSSPYSGPHDAGIVWSDPTLAVQWPFPYSDLHMSDKDRAQPALVDAPLFD